MFADRMELVAAVVAAAWLVLAATTAVVARRRAVPRRLVHAESRRPGLRRDRHCA